MNPTILKISIGALVFLLSASGWAVEGEAIDYGRDIKPIFAEHCVACHGALKQNGGLRLDTAAAMRSGGDSGPAVVAGDAKGSLLIDVLTGDAGFTMPPEGEGRRLDSRQRTLIERWIEAGAPSPADERPQQDPRTYWSYQPLRPVAIPAPTDDWTVGADWIRNPIDAFVAAKYHEQQLTPEPPAEPQVLLRRVYLDLVGHPPTRSELEQFLADPSDRAYEAVVDNLLTRPQYGERWGRHWMDVWRYSDWYGRRPSNEIRYSQRHIWRWRDWIIRSLNEDKGYDRMITEMLAADEIAPHDNQALAATGFLGRNWYKFDKNTWLFETVEQTSRGLMATTMQCCRCHDHKYDPISQLEYYQYRAFFEPHGFRTDPLGDSAATEVDNGKAEVLSDGLSRAFDEEPGAKTFLFRRGDDRDPDRERPLQPAVPEAFGNDALHIEPVSLPATSYMPHLSSQAIQQNRQRGDAAVAAAKKTREKVEAEITRLREQIQVVENADIAFKTKPFLSDEFDLLDETAWSVVSGQWSVAEGRLSQSQVTSFATLVSRENHPRNFVARVRYRKLQPGTYRSVGFSFDYTNGGNDSQDVYTARSDAKPQGSVQAFHRVKGRQIYPAEAITTADITVGQWNDLEFTVRETQLTIRFNGEVKLEYTLPLARVDGKFAIWVHQGAAEFDRLHITPLVPTVDELQRAVEAAEHQLDIASLEVKIAEATAAFEQQRITADRVKFGVQAGDASRAALAAHRAELTIPVLHAERELLKAQRRVETTTTAGSAPKAQHDPPELQAARDKLVTAQQQLGEANGDYTAVEAKYPAQSTGRRSALARWLTEPTHPRTSRVAVNHIWLRHFGEAIVPSTDNFGMSGKQPSHPELLDWLANELVTHRWSMKHLHKQIVMSNAYRLSSRPATQDNPNLRRDPENIYLWRAHWRRMEAEVIRDSLLAVSGTIDWSLGGPDIDESTGQKSRRRSLYFRTTPDNQMEMLALFDQANPDECYRRKESVVPQQALALMNGRLAIDMSRVLAGKLSEEIASASDEGLETDSDFVKLAFTTVLSRPPTAGEIADCLQYLRETTQLLRDSKSLTPFPPSPEKPTVSPAAAPEQRARESLIHVLLNHNEFVTIR